MANEVKEQSNLGKSSGGFIGALIKKIIVLAIIGGIGYGGWIWYSQKGGKQAIDKVAEEKLEKRSDKVEGSVGVGTDRKKMLENAVD